MSARRIDFEVTLPSTINPLRNNPSNLPNDYTTRLSSPIEFEGSDWEVALMDLHYSHNWYNVHRNMKFSILVKTTDSPEKQTSEPQVATGATEATTNLSDSANAEKIDISFARDHSVTDAFERSVKALRNEHGWNYIMRFATIPKGNYASPMELCDIFKREISHTFPKTSLDVELEYDKQRKVVFGRVPRDTIIIVAEREHSILDALGFTNVRTEENQAAGPNTVSTELRLEYMTFDETVRRGTREPSIRQLSSMIVYTDFVEHSLFGDTQAPYIGYIPIMSSFGSVGHWAVNPPYYHKVTKQRIEAIRIVLKTHTGENFPITDGEVICRLHFRRRNRFF